MKKPAQPSLGLINGLSCLQDVISIGRPVGPAEVAAHLNLERTRINRLLGTLCFLGYLNQTEDRKYRPGPGIHVLAAQSLRASGLLRSALPVIKKLVCRDYNVALGVLWQDKVCYLYHGEPSMAAEGAITDHGLYPALNSSIGRAILAFRPDLAADIKEFNEKAALDIRETGYCLLRKDKIAGSLGVAIGEPAFAGLAFAGKISEAEVPRLATMLHKAASAIVKTMQKDGQAFSL
ncbi:MAG: hypothetical protein A2268_06560 [Candidatus Raymondbacteria bacterium RifOxyA12_full_50_37]|uniref:HTH iclR-type domain-containing protein n=1 Tax=Candidatus Raymondbacteria bacterium RIFOXYD12_FULL_49_13 TaxID=1817890 RepID=A0A1F7EZT0_UNCRA|nr:MAG: hypothetical protein A2350_02400 [Candidatus Raymondbacteria bacterium RifOxyB12_full_50_8]OGJ92188.1 MAG: hypothetical protein A2268_06560 [Candidatus Raymondbacteria bacterium RifOxyA12_full_50_37]OGJ94229.1 MAG: hypothetical protein A2487_17405 [Candidatus Raymondbacteria bacterium RifOxyC12_full_50_8]OGJ94471.1 MAG: hypothetical protein A2248_15490 [Candidatus Raymondbacteria bacterium RIFOXYA2_FULL_49_16]OGJ99227.1 MAG: hypothetical protein A2453_07340 [Candidatus Raymondbacteria b